MSAHRDRRISGFLQIAHEEREAASRLVEALPRQALYFVQQSVEKLLRAVLEAEGIVAGASHNLRYLCDLLPEGHYLKEDFVAFDVLSSASTRYRYPSTSGVVATVNAQEARDWLVRLAPLDDAVRRSLLKPRA